MAEDDRTRPTDDTTVIISPAPPSMKLRPSNLKRAAEFLIESSRLGPLRTHYDKYRRYVSLHSQQMYDSLVSLYTGLFSTQWQHFRRFMDTFPPPPGVTPQTYAARSYISMWFIDLYVSNREAVRKISSLAFNERYSGELLRVSPEYDQYLTLLNASIRPTHISLTMEDTLYIPYISEEINIENHNPFNITNFVEEEELFYGLLQIMKDRKTWIMSELSHDTLGRPCWLFDWHTDNRVAAWFHMEGNFGQEDVTIAYILGVACTPKLAPRDVDDWQFFPNAIVPQIVNPAHYQRVVPRRFHGSYEVRTIEVDDNYIHPFATIAQIQPAPNPAGRRPGKGKGKKGTTAASAAEQTVAAEPSNAPSELSQDQDEEMIQIMPRYRIIDWTYYYLVVQQSEMHTRTGALRMISLT